MSTVYAADYGFNAEDATSAIQRAINDPNAEKVVIQNLGAPWIISEQISLKDNVEIVFEEGVVVQTKSNSFLDNKSSMFQAENVDNIKLTGEGSGDNLPTLQMNSNEYVGDAANNQYNHVINLFGVNGYEIRNLTLSGAGGDGIHIAGGSFEKPPEDKSILTYSANGLIDNVVSSGNRRQGLSIDSAENLLVTNSVFENTAGVEPSAGIDLEPTWDFERLKNITIKNVKLDGNEGWGIQMALGNLDDSSEPVSIDIRGADIKNMVGDRGAILIDSQYLANYSSDIIDRTYKGVADHSQPNSTINGAINIENVTISNAERINSGFAADNPRTYIVAQDIPGNLNDPNNLQVNFDSVQISDPLDSNVVTTPIYISGLPGEDKPSEIGNLSFNNVTVEGNYGLPVVFTELLNEDANLNNISGAISVFNNGDGEASGLDTEPLAQNLTLNVLELKDLAPSSSSDSIGLANPSFTDELTGWRSTDEAVSLVEPSSNNDWVEISYQLSAMAQPENSETFASYNNEATQLQEFDSGDFAG